MTVWIRLMVGMAALAWAGAVSAEQVTLRMWMHEHPPRIPIDKQIVAEFEKANPDIKIDHEIIPVAEYPTKLLTAFAAGSGPDIFNQSSMLVAQYYTTTHTSWHPSTMRRWAWQTRQRWPRNIPAASTASASRVSCTASPPK